MTPCTCADVDTTLCPRCLGRLRANLHSIADDMALMPAAATERGINTEPAVLAGPSANPILHRWRQINADRAGLFAEEPDEDDPYTALATRERMIREHLGHDTAVLCSETLAGVVAYLASNRAGTDTLGEINRSEDMALVLLDLEATARHLRGRLDATLRNSHAPELGAPCPECAADNEDGKARPLVKRYVDSDPSGASDKWECGECGTWWSEADYRLRIAARYLEHADRLTASQMLDVYRIKPGALRKWAERGQVSKRGKDEQGRQLYDVAAAIAMRDRASVVTEAGA